METENKRKAGRPAGTGPKSISLAELNHILQGRNDKVSVTHKWLEQMGVDPSRYEPWKPNGKRATPKLVLPRTVEAIEPQEQEQQEEIEFTLTA